jgi:elongation factor P
MGSVADLRKGLTIIIDGDPWTVISFEFVKPGKGQAIYRTKMRNILTGSVVERTYRSGESLDVASLETRKVQYLYREGSNFTFMDNSNYEQITLDEDALGDAVNYLIDNLEVEILTFRDKPLGVTVPSFVHLKVVEAETWAKGDTSGSDSKTVKMETGYNVKVPPFIKQGDTLMIDTRTGQYVTRV